VVVDARRPCSWILEAGESSPFEGWQGARSGRALMVGGSAICGVSSRGANPSLRDDQGLHPGSIMPAVARKFGDRLPLTLRDACSSIPFTVAGRHLLPDWCEGASPRRFSEDRQPDVRGELTGCNGREMNRLWLTHLHQPPPQGNILVRRDPRREVDDFSTAGVLAADRGAKTGLELARNPSIRSFTMGRDCRVPDGHTARAFVCQTLNPSAFPARIVPGGSDMVDKCPHRGRG